MEAEPIAGLRGNKVFYESKKKLKNFQKAQYLGR